MTDYFTVDNTRLEYSWAGERRADGAAIVLLHEGLGSVDLWRHFPTDLAERSGLPVFAYSRAGYGRSDPVTLPRPTNYLDDEAEGVLPGVLDAAGIRRAVLVGHSDGGTIALLAAASDAVRARIAGAVTMAAHVFVEDITLRGLEAARAAWEDGNLRSRLARWHGPNVDCAFHGWNDTWRDPAFRHWNMEHRLRHITAPVLAIQGAGDEYGTPAQVAAIAAGIPGPVETWIIPDCGHTPHQDAASAVLDRIALFTDRVML